MGDGDDQDSARLDRVDEVEGEAPGEDLLAHAAATANDGSGFGILTQQVDAREDLAVEGDRERAIDFVQTRRLLVELALGVGMEVVAKN